MDTSDSIILEADELAGDLLFVACLLRQYRSGMELHRGVLVVVVVTVGVEHKQRTRNAEESAHVIIRCTHLLEHLHFLRCHLDIGELLKSLNRQDVMTSVEFLLNLAGVFICLLLVVATGSECALWCCATIFADESLHATALCSRFE